MASKNVITAPDGVIFKYWFKFITVFVFTPILSFSQITSKSILNKCIQFHDPQSTLLKSGLEYEISIKRTNAKDRYFKINTNLKKRFFVYSVQSDSLFHKQGFKNGSFFHSLRNDYNITNDDEKKYDLGLERTQYLKKVYEYLLYIPSKLSQDLDFLSEDFTIVQFNNKNCYRIKFEYDPNGVNETWYFYIDTNDFSLVGYKFFKQNENTDGEYIVLKNFRTVLGYVIPFQKDWYWNHDKSFFRSDKILLVKKFKVN
jgi:hypothetical protein